MPNKIVIDNIYIGSEVQVKCCTAFYDVLMAEGEVTPEMILAKINGENLHAYDGMKLDELFPNDKYRSCQKQIMNPMFEILKRHVDDDIQRVHIGNHHYKYVYNGDDNDPLREMRQSAVRKSVEDFRDFCMDSAGFFPESWMNHFFRNTQELLDIKEKEQKGESVMMVSVNRKHDNIELLPLLYEKIKSKTVIEFDYHHQYKAEVEHRIIHPHFLHEFNGRWHLFGYEKDGKFNPANVAIDRIEGSIADNRRIRYKDAEPGFYDNYLKDIVGVTRELKDEQIDWDNSEPHAVRLRAYSRYMYGLIGSKPLHRSQEPMGGYDEEKGYGDFALSVKLNNEFIGRVLQMGHQLEIVEPQEFRDVFAARVAKMAEKYGVLEKK